MLATYVPSLRNSKLEIRPAGSSGRLQCLLFFFSYFFLHPYLILLVVCVLLFGLFGVILGLYLTHHL